MFLEKKYPHSRDDSIRFIDESHTYYVKWDESEDKFDSEHIISVTSFVHRYFHEFNPKETIAKMKSGKSWHKSVYFGMSTEQILQSWEDNRVDACRRGTLLHNQIENSYNGIEPENADITTEYRQFLSYRERVRLHWIPFRTEWKVRTDKDHRLTGTIDMIFIHSNRARRESIVDGKRLLHIRIVDWKRSKKIRTFSPWRQGKSICHDLPDTNYSHYALQLNAYKYILETFYGGMTVEGVEYDRIVVDEMFLVVMHPNRKRYVEIKIPKLPSHISNMFNERALLLGRI